MDVSVNMIVYGSERPGFVETVYSIVVGEGRRMWRVGGLLSISAVVDRCYERGVEVLSWGCRCFC